MKNKICINCKENKPIVEFSKNKRCKDGYHYYCRLCKSLYAKKFYTKNRDEIIAKEKEYRANPIVRQRKIESCRKWHSENKDLLKEKNKRYNQTPNRKEQRKQERIRNRDRYIRYNKEYRKTDKYKFLDKNKRHRRRAITKITDISEQWLNNLFNKTSHCELCNIELVDNGNIYPNGKHLDHILPLIAGGEHKKNNVRFICFKCNVSRPKDGSDLLKLVI